MTRNINQCPQQFTQFKSYLCETEAVALKFRFNPLVRPLVTPSEGAPELLVTREVLRRDKTGLRSSIFKLFVFKP